MGILNARRNRRAVTLADFGIDSIFGSWRAKSGVLVDYRAASGLATAWRCATLIADTCMILPLDQLRKVDGRAEEVLPRNPFLDRPHPRLTSEQWRSQAIMSLCFWGNAYGLRVIDDDGRTIAVDWLNPSDVTVTETRDRVIYRWQGRELDPTRVVHLRRWMQPGSVVGIAPLERQKETFGLATAARDFVAGWFKDAPAPAGILKTDAVIDDDQARVAKERLMAAVRSRQPLALGSSWSYQPFTPPSPRDADLADLNADLQIAVCQVFGVQPEMVNLATRGSSITYANREQRVIDFLVFTMQPWMTLLERFLTDELADGSFVRFNPGALLRTDTHTRYKVHDLAIRAGIKSVNEIRELEDLPPIDDPLRDNPLWPPYRTNPTANEQEEGL